MRYRKSILPALFLSITLFSPPFARSDEAVTYQLLPKSVQLHHNGDLHRLLVEEFTDGLATGDLTAGAKFTSSDESVVTAGADGMLQAAGSGKAVVTAEINGKTITAEVTVSGADEKYVWSFANDVQPALTKLGCNAGACHGAAAGKNGFRLSLRGFDHVNDHASMTRQANGRRVLLGNPADSMILQKPAGKIPHGGGRLIREGSPEYRMILEWIQQGAPEPSPDDVDVVRIESIPNMIRLDEGEKQQLVVLAYYEDGKVRDVTRWVKYDTTEDGVAVVDRDGMAEMKGSGSAALTVWYNSKVSFTTVNVPFPEEVDAQVFASAERKNYIDDRIFDQLQALNIPPSKPSTDNEFIRRAYLDATGVLPTKDEILRFILDPAQDKRARLIDELLERPEYADLWAYKWSDLLLVSTRNLRSNEAMWAFYRFIRKNVAENRGWNKMAYDIVTAQGSNLDNGAGNYFLIHKETTDLTETTSQAFLGMSVTCARCHNHPLEKWTQDQYYKFANLFARVALKNGDRAGETFVVSTDRGEVLHPIRNTALAPTPLDGDPLMKNGEKDRRQHLAEWLTSEENPYFARAIINRVWKHVMGVGLVEPEDDLRLTNPPVNEPLFAALEKDFVKHGYDVKHLIRTIMNSAAYQRSSQPFMGNERDNNHFSRYYMKRLPAEVILDAYSQTTSVPTNFPGYPKGWRALQLPDSDVASQFLTTFGRPERNLTCACERESVPTLPQSLHISNGETLNNKLRAEDNVLGGYLDENLPLRDILIDIYIRTLSRAPSEDEIKAVMEAVHEEEGWKATAREEKRLILEDVLWAILSGKEFLFNH